jgi:hypothetical protein
MSQIKYKNVCQKLMYIDPASNQQVKKDKKKYDTLDDAVKKDRTFIKLLLINVLSVLNII